MRIPENMIEFSPLSIKGKKALAKLLNRVGPEHAADEAIRGLQNEDYFLHEYYIKPFTRRSINWINDDVSDDDIEKVYDICVLQDSKEKFEKELDENMAKLLWICGNSGCGKSTYVHKLGQEHRQKIKMLFYDFEGIDKRCIIKGDGQCNYIIGDDTLWSNSTIFKFIILLINSIVENICINKIANPDGLSAFTAIVNEYFRHCDPKNDFEYVINFFNALKEVAEKSNRKNGIEKVHRFFNDIIEEYREESAGGQNGLEDPCVIKLMNILLQILLHKGDIEGKSYACVFDNIEYTASLEYDENRVLITDRSIEIILNCLHSAVSSCVYQTINRKFMHVPKVIAVTRNATVAFNGNMELNNYQKVEITNWYCAKEIYEKRYGLVSRYINSNERVAYEAFQLIMSDCTMSKWSLVPFLSKLFNYNIRRMPRILLHILTINCMRSGQSEKGNLERMITMWKNCEEKRKKETNPDNKEVYSRTKHFFRMYIIRLVLDSFNGIPRELGFPQNDAYLNKLMVELGNIDECKQLTIPCDNQDLLVANRSAFTDCAEGEHGNAITENINRLKEEKLSHIETSFTRRILTILHRVEIDDLYTGNNRSLLGVKYYDFEDLLSDLLLDGNNQDINTVSPETIKKIGDILYLMNEVTDSTGWVPLTSIKWKNTEEKYTRNAIGQVLDNAYFNLRNRKEPDCSYGIRITYAGQMFLMLLPEFEYFATRFCPFEPKLISDRSMRKGTGKDGQFACEKNIRKVMYHSVMCAYTVIIRAKSEYSTFGAHATIDYRRMHQSNSVYSEFNNSRPIMHADRLFKRQRGYLEIYKKYITILEPAPTRFKDDNEKNELLQAIDSLISDYDKWSDYFRRAYPYYSITEE